jgi:tetratricopeptide (TPR) repeat protein
MPGRAVLPGPAAKVDTLFSPSVAERFYAIAYEVANSKDITGLQAEQAIAFLAATRRLENDADRVTPLMIKLACRYAERDYSAQVFQWLVDYIGESSDLEVVTEAVSYLLEPLNSRQQRERLLEGILKNVAGKNSVVDSQLETWLGLLEAEKADFKAAQSHLVEAYKNNRYNKIAFSKLAELVPEQVGPAMYLEHLRLVLREDPVDIDAALNLAQYAERLQLYEMAAGTYEYCADLFEYLYPGETPPPHIYLPWVISSYNTQRSQHKCLQIAKRIRKTGHFDILLEALAGKAAAKIGNIEEATRIFLAAEEKAQQLLRQGPSPEAGGSPQVGAMQFAWFYCFALEDEAKALDWANRAYSVDPNSPAGAALLAYALLINDQLEWAKPLIENYEHNQIAELVVAQIKIAEGQRDAAVETLKSAIAKDPGSLAAERAKDMLAELGAEYFPPVDPDVILTVLTDRFDRTLIPEFVSPEKMISVQFSIRGQKFSYGSTFDGAAAITNNGSEPVVVSDDGLFRGNIRVDATISGDINKDIPNLLSRKVRNTLLIESGRSMLIPLELFTGELRRTLLTHPQASLDIEFTLYLDPVTTADGQVTNRLVDIKPIKAVVKRPRVELTGEYLRNRFNSLSTGQAGQKINTAQLFIGLLKEQYAMADHGALYKFKYADWMPTLLKSALLHASGLLRNPADNEWVVKVHTMADMLSLPLDHELTSAVAENLNNSNWPARMMAIYLLSKNQGDRFNKVLAWSAQYDSDKLVRDMAVALGAAKL